MLNKNKSKVITNIKYEMANTKIVAEDGLVWMKTRNY